MNSSTTSSQRFYNAPCQCFLNAYLNQQGIYKSLDLKMVVGSVGWNTWFEYGGKAWTLIDFVKAKKGKNGGWDAHCWLEDDKGNIYDYISEMDDLYTRFRTGKGLKVKGVVAGVSKADLLAKGIEYVPADADTQYAIFKSDMTNIIRDAEHLSSDDALIILSDGGKQRQTISFPGGYDAVLKDTAKIKQFRKMGYDLSRTYILL
jgi:hypothetical protein